jgi:hypothetical protein
MTKVTVYTSDAYDELEARVTALEEASGSTPPPDPSPPDGTGLQAKRIADLVESFGVNTFSSLDANSNVWGSWPADYSPATVIKALKYLTNDSGFVLKLREYHYSGRESFQVPWLHEIQAALPGTQVTVCVGANGSANDTTTMIQMQHDPACGIVWLEGQNEPNTDFGSGMVPQETTHQVQSHLWHGAFQPSVVGPSVVAGTPHPAGWITGYFDPDASMRLMNNKMAYGNAHIYPPASPDVADTGYSIAEYVGEIFDVYGGVPVMVTEFHPTLYNSRGHKPDEPGWSGERDAYYTMTTLFRCCKMGLVEGLWWYALFDYGTTYTCGLFPVNADDPRPAANAIRALCTVTADHGEDRRTFDPGSLEVEVIGLPPTADYDLCQASDGRFFVTLWNNAEDPGGEASDVTLNFAEPVTLAEYVVSLGEMEPRQRVTGQSITVALDASARVVVVE